MKQLVVSMLCFLTITGAFSQEMNTIKCNITPFNVYIDDADEFSSIRNSPNGEIVLKISNTQSYGYILNVIGFKNNWLKIDMITGVDSYRITNFVGWVHSSIIAASVTHTTNLFNKPNGNITGQLKGETGAFKIIDVHCNWVKIKTQQHIGWIASENICGNPVTTCP